MRPRCVASHCQLDLIVQPDDATAVSPPRTIAEKSLEDAITPFEHPRGGHSHDIPCTVPAGGPSSSAGRTPCRRRTKRIRAALRAGHRAMLSTYIRMHSFIDSGVLHSATDLTRVPRGIYPCHTTPVRRRPALPLGLDQRRSPWALLSPRRFSAPPHSPPSPPSCQANGGPPPARPGTRIRS